MTNANTNSHLSEVSALVDASVQAQDKATGNTAKVAVLFWEMMQTQELDSATVQTYATGNGGKTLANATLHDLCTLYSAKYREGCDLAEAVKDEKKVERQREMKDQSTRYRSAAKQTVSRALLIAAWLHATKPTKVTVKSTGAVRLQHENENVDGTYTLNGLEKQARNTLRPQAVASTRTAGATGAINPVASLKTCAEFLSNNVSGKERGALGKDTDAILQTTLAALLGYFASKGAGIDVNKVSALYKASANGESIAA